MDEDAEQTSGIEDEAAEMARLEQEFKDGKFTETTEPAASDTTPEPAGEDTGDPESHKEPALESDSAAIQEAKRLRQKNREVNDEVMQLRTQLQELAAKVEATPPTPELPKDPVKTASLDELVDADLRLDEQAFLARQEGDEAKLAEVMKIKKTIKMEIAERPKAAIAKESQHQQATQQWADLETAVITAHPDIKDPNSTLFQKAKTWAEQNPQLMEQLGPAAGNLIATAQALALTSTSSPNTVSVTGNAKSVVAQIEDIAAGTTAASGSSTAPSKSPNLNFNTMSDEDFEVYWEKAKQGEAVIPA